MVQPLIEAILTITMDLEWPVFPVCPGLREFPAQGFSILKLGRGVARDAGHLVDKPGKSQAGSVSGSPYRAYVIQMNLVCKPSFNVPLWEHDRYEHVDSATDERDQGFCLMETDLMIIWQQQW